MSRVNVGHYVLGNVGLALLRTWLTGDRAEADRRSEELRDLLNATEPGPLSIELEANEETVVSGYARWSSSYDSLPNPLIELEEPIVQRIIDKRPPGNALDAACGTGRHTKYLHQRGHRCIGVDCSPEMLERARTALPGVELREGDLGALPLEAAEVDLVVCALALTHCAELDAPIAELRRVLRPGGRLIVSDLHPAMLLIGGTGFFLAADGGAGYVRSYPHSHAAYLAAFRHAGLRVTDCIEPRIGPEHLQSASAGLADLAPEAFRAALVGFPMALIWELCIDGS